MKAVTRLLIIAAFSGLLTACGHSFPVEILPDTLTYTEYYKGNVIQTAVVRKGTPIYDAIYKILADNGSGWDIDDATYAPVEYFRAENVTVNCMDNLVAINYPDEKGKWQQLSKKINGCKNAINNAKIHKAQ